MKITKIEKESGIYKVTREPRLIGRILGMKQRVDEYKCTGDTYVFGGGHLYVDKKGVTLGNNLGYGSDTREAIDNWRRSF